MATNPANTRLTNAWSVDAQKLSLPASSVDADLPVGADLDLLSLDPLTPKFDCRTVSILSSDFSLPDLAGADDDNLSCPLDLRPFSPISFSRFIPDDDIDVQLEELENKIAHDKFYAEQAKLLSVEPCYSGLDSELLQNDAALRKQEIVAFAKRNQLYVTLFPNGPDAFAFDVWRKGMFDGLSIKEIARVCYKANRYSSIEQQCAIIEMFVSIGSESTLRSMISSHVLARRKSATRGRTSRGSKAWRHLAFLKHARKTTRYYEEMVPDPKIPYPTLRDFFPGATKTLRLGLFTFENVGEFQIVEKVFSRDKALYRSIVTSEDFTDFQALLMQKYLSDRNFRNRLTALYLRLHPEQVLQAKGLDLARGTLEEGRDHEKELAQEYIDLHEKTVRYAQMIRNYRFKQDQLESEAEEPELGISGGFLEIAKIGTTISLILKARSTAEVMKIAFLYFSGSRLVAFADDIEGYYNSHYGQSLQSEGGTLEDICEDTLALLGISNILGSLMGTALGECVSFSPIIFLKDRFKTLSKMHLGDDKLRKFWSTMKCFLTTLKECCLLRSIDPLFDSGESPSQLLKQAESIHDYRNVLCVNSLNNVSAEFLELRTSGKIPNKWTRPWLPSEYIEEVTQLLAKMDVALPLVSSQLASIFRSARDRLHVIVSTSVDTFAANSFRTPPLGIVLTGLPGVGKSMLMKAIIRSVGAFASYPTDASAVYMWKMDVNFQDGLTPSHMFYIMDDVDISLTQPVRGQPDHTTAIMQVCDSKPFPIESADVGSKGKNFGRPMMVLYGTNNENLKLTTFITDVSAIKRRLPIRARVTPAARYCKGTGAVDFDAAREADDPDLHDIHVDLYDPTIRDYAPYKVMDNTEFIRYVGQRFVDHLSNHTSLVSKESPLCSVCCTVVKRGETLCRFCQPRLQGGSLAGMQCMTDIKEITNRADRILTDAEQQNLVGRGGAILTRLERVVPQSLPKIVTDPIRTISDFIMSPKGLTIAAITAALILVKVMMDYTELQGRYDNSTQQLPPNFVRLSTEKPPGVPFGHTTYTQDQMEEGLRRSFAIVSGGKLAAHAIRVGLDLFLLNHHVLKESKTYYLQFEGLTYQGSTEGVVAQIGQSDVILLRVANVPATPHALSYFWPNVDSSYSTFDSVYMLADDERTVASTNQIVSETGYGYYSKTLQTDIWTMDGDCGFPMIAECGGRFRVVGIHHSQLARARISGVQCKATAPLVTQQDIKLAAARIGGECASARVLQGMFPKGLKQGDLKGPNKSEVSLSLDKGAHIVNRGHDLASVGSTASKSTCFHSPYYDEVEEWCSQEVGEHNYFQVPNLRGRMLEVEGGEKWISPYQYIHEYYKPLQDFSIFRAPILDYIAPFKDCDISGYASLSVDQAVYGVESSAINPVNFKTSVGPPYSGPKDNWISRAGGAHPIIITQVKEILECLEANEIPIPLAACTLKDEPVKKSKNEKRDIRVFMCLPAAWNIVCKMYLAAIKLFLRNNSDLSESMVGINLAGSGAADVVSRLSRISPHLDNIVEGDYTKMDKTINGVLASAIVEVFGHIATILSLDAEKVKLLVWSNFHVIYSIKGDLYQVGGMNPSGSDITVEINAIANALCHRFAWLSYFNHPTLSLQEYRNGDYCLDFRASNVLITYGDDFLVAHAKRLDLARLFACFAPTGMTVTDGQKLDNPTYRSINQVYFLKRTFFIEPQGTYAGLDLKSIFRMLMIFKKSTLSVREHAAIVLEEALRELFLRRDQNFELWRQRFIVLAQKHNLDRSGYLKLQDAQYYESQWQNGTFTSWIIDSPTLLEVNIEEQQSRLQSQMTSILDQSPALGGISSGATPSATSIVAYNHPTTAIVGTTSSSTYGTMTASSEGGVNLTHPVGNVETVTAPVIAGGMGIRQRDQAMAVAGLGDFLGRAVLLPSLTMTSFANDTTVSFFPWQEWASIPTVADKLKNFNFITGSIKIRGVVEAPPLCAGLVCVSAIPCYEPSSNVPIPRSLCAVVEHVMVDLSTSSSFELTLPWVGASNWGNLTDDLFALNWFITARTLAPLITAVPEGCTSAMIRFFALPGDDFELSGAKLQALRAHATSVPRGPKSSGAQRAGGVPSTSGGAIAPKALQDGASYVQSTTGYKPSEIASSVAVGAGIGAMVPTPATPWLSAISAGSAALAKVLDYFGMTRETTKTEICDAQIRVVGNLINCDGPDNARVAGLFSSNALSRNPHIAGGLSSLDETSFSYIGGKYTLLGDITYIVGDTAPGDVVLPVTPFLFTQLNTFEFMPTTAGYIGSRFRFWRGDVKFLFYIVSSAAHRGAFQFIWQPTADVTPGADYTNVSLNTIVDIEPARPIEIKIGYNNDYPACLQDFYALDTPISPSDYETINGYLRIRNIVPLTGSICGQEIKMLVFAAAGDNMEFFAPDDTMFIEGDPFPLGKDVHTLPTLQSGVIGAEGQGLLSIELVPSSGVYPIVENLAGEAVRSIKALCQKPSSINFLEGDNRLMFMQHGPFEINNILSSTNYLRYYGSMYLGFAGSIRSKLIIVKDEESEPHWPFACPAQVPLSYIYPSQLGGMPVSEFNPIFTDDFVTSDILLPYYHRELYVPAYKSHQRFDVAVWEGTEQWNCTLARYKSAGPDARYIYFRAQNKFSTQFPLDHDDVKVFGLISVAEPTSPPDFLFKGGKTSSESDKIDVEWYRARTGRDGPKNSRFRRQSAAALEKREAT